MKLVGFRGMDRRVGINDDVGTRYGMPAEGPSSCDGDVVGHHLEGGRPIPFTVAARAR
jgi:hypothetical protein